jgi:8-oxo-dGTP diphosphatase
MTHLTTLCYLEQDGKYLMLHRTKKERDINKDKWIGIGGKFEPDESPEDCMLREFREETGCELTDYVLRGVVTFISGDGLTEYMFLYGATGYTGVLRDCDEGELVWVDKARLRDLYIWEGDKIFLDLLEQTDEFFSLKLVYDGSEGLVSAVLNGKGIR